MTEELILEARELIALGEKKGRVLPVSAAFEMYPVEEEFHKGKLEFWKGEVDIEV